MTPRRHISLVLLLGVHMFLAVVARASEGPASEAYFQQATQIVFQLTLPKFAGHFDTLSRSGPLKLTYRIRANGTLEGVRVTYGNPKSFVAQTFVNAIRSAKFPPIPKAVLKEQGKNFIDITATMQ